MSYSGRQGSTRPRYWEWRCSRSTWFSSSPARTCMGVWVGVAGWVMVVCVRKRGCRAAFRQGIIHPCWCVVCEWDVHGCAWLSRHRPPSPPPLHTHSHKGCFFCPNVPASTAASHTVPDATPPPHTHTDIHIHTSKGSPAPSGPEVCPAPPQTGPG